MHCPRCGAFNGDAATACAACGSALVPLAPSAAPGAPAAWGQGAPPPERPTGVTLIAVYDFVTAAFLVLVGFFVMVAAALFAGFFGLLGADSDAVAGIGMVIGFLVLALAGLHVGLGIAVLKGKAWARIVQMVLAGLSLAGFVFGLLGVAAEGEGFNLGFNLVQGALGGVILWYLFQPEAKRFFGGA